MTQPVAIDMACMMVASAPGTGTTIALGQVVPFGGLVSFAQGGATNGMAVFYYIQDGNNREFGSATYSTTGPSLTGRTVITASVNGVQQSTPINATANAVVSSIESNQSIQAQFTSLQSSLQAEITTNTNNITTLQNDIAAGHTFIGRTVYTSSQTITIPGTMAVVRLVGGGGGANSSSGSAAAGSGAYLEKTLSGLTVSHTLTLTIGAGGTTSPTSGGNSSLASGTQTISTLTANGGGAAFNNGGSGIVGNGGTASSGDLNIAGGQGSCAVDSTDNFFSALGGSNPLGPSASCANTGGALSASAPGNNYGGGAVAASYSGTASAAGAPGVCIIDWYA